MALNLLRRLWRSTPAAIPAKQPIHNQHGHLIITVTGLDIPGAQEVERQRAGGYRVDDYARSCFLSTIADSYDKNHRLVAAQYTIALMPTKEIEDWHERTTANLCRRGIERYGYTKPLAGIVPRIRETITDEMMEQMGFWFIAAPHDPIKDSGGDPRVLDANRGGGGRSLGACWDCPGNWWYDDGAFAFLASAS